MKYAGALFSLRSIYSTLSSSASSWLSSQNAQAQQLSANIDYMKYAMGSVFAPVIEYVTNLVYSLMKAVQSLVYAFSGVNIFAKATASSMNSASGSASKASKSLSGIHNEINNVSDNESSGGSGSGSTSPSMDLSQVDTEMSSLSQKLYDFFKPLVDSWNTYGSGLIEQLKTTASQVIELISSVWGSFENIITNGTVYSILENILAIIGNIAEAFSNAWNYNGNGDAIIQNLANALNNLLGAIDNVIQSQGFQDWLNNCSDKFRTISEKLSEIDWQPLIEALTDIGETIGTTALDILNGLVDIFKWLVENPIVLEIILGIAVAIGIVSTAISILSAVIFILEAGLLPIIGIIVAIIAVIALIIVAIINWDNIIKALKDTWEWIKQKAVEIWNAVAEFFKNLWQGICNTVKNVWNGIKEFLSNLWQGIKNIVHTVFNAIATFFSNIWNGIKTVISTVWNKIKETISNVVTTIKDKVTTAFTNIKDKITSIMDKVKTTLSDIWNGIWSTIKGVINSIIGGVESMCNTVIRGINKILTPLTKVGNTILEAVGIKSFSFSTIAEVSLPRLAKGGVLTEATAVVAGEYSGAKSNPEIVTPQNIMRDTIEDVLAEHEYNRPQDAGTLKQLVIKFGSMSVAVEMDKLLQQARRQNGTATVTV